MSAEDRADEGVRLSEDEQEALYLALPDDATGAQEREVFTAAERIIAARLAQVEHMHDDAERRVDALTARLADVERERDLHKRADRDSAWEIARERARADALVEQVALLSESWRASAGDDRDIESKTLRNVCAYLDAALDRARGLDGAS